MKPILVPFTMNGRLFFGQLISEVGDLLHLEIDGVVITCIRGRLGFRFARFRRSIPITQPATNPPPAEPRS